MNTSCYFCTRPIQAGDVVNEHHVTYRSQGGAHTEPTHQECHQAYHSERGDFRAWGRQGGLIAAQTFAWAFNLRGVRDDKAYDVHREMHSLLHAKVGRA